MVGESQLRPRTWRIGPLHPSAADDNLRNLACPDAAPLLCRHPSRSHVALRNGL